jgi:valyl-tRNA synthetase
MRVLDTRYDPHALEAKWYRRALERGDYRSDPSRGGEPYCIMMPPPNVTGILHMGHALNNTLQDILIRWRRMQGRNTLWQAGTDHAGIATQNVVERALRKEGKRRDDLGREAFIQRVWQWKEEYGHTIIEQLKSLGAACDWSRARFTMDPGMSRAVTEVFVRLYNKGLIYRGERIINWCPRCRTALSDEESEHRETAGRLYYLRYPLEEPAPDGKTFLVVATTRPETLLGDTAVAVNPKDPRYRGLVGRRVRLPVLGRLIPVIEDAAVDPDFGTGAVKVTPAHDPNDFEMGGRHGIPRVNVMTDDGRMNEGAGPYQGLDRFECRKAIMADLETAGLLEKIEEHTHAVGSCYRCDTVVEPRLSQQWFVRMKPLAEPALAAVRDGRIRFVPERWTKVYLEWMENIRDWCISRQIWWGHRIPVFTCERCGHEWAALEPPSHCASCGGGAIRQEEDVLDTWFSSWLWPFSTLGWPEQTPELAFYYPTHTLVTASEIIFFWVARMIMAGLEFMGDIPFRDVVIHGTVRDDRGRKMSKSLGNSIDPREIIRDASADALRFSLTMLTAIGQDVYVSKEKFEVGRNFGTKIWNAARFIQMQGPSPGPAAGRLPEDASTLRADDRHLLFRLRETVIACTEHLERYRFNDAAHAVYDFFWHQFCDWYVESVKPVLRGEDPARASTVRHLLHHALHVSLRLLHPFMPFLSEELWQAMGYGESDRSILFEPWPVPPTEEQLAALGATPAVAAFVEEKRALIRAGRMLRADCGIAPSAWMTCRIVPADPADAETLRAEEPILRVLLRAAQIAIEPGYVPPGPMPSAVTRLGTIYLPIEGQVDAARESRRLSGELEKIEIQIARVRTKLDNPDFVAKADSAVVERQRDQLQELTARADRLRELIGMLRG